MSEPRRSTRRRKAAPDEASTELRLLDALRDLMVERDSLDVSLLDIAQRAGVNHGLVGYYFGNKEGMYVALLRLRGQSTAPMLKALLARDGSPEVKLKLHIKGVLAAYALDPLMSELLDYLLKSASPAAAKEVSDMILQPMIDFYDAIVKEGVASGTFRPVDPMFLHMLVIGACTFPYGNRPRLRIGYGVNEITPSFRDRYSDFLAEGIVRAIAA